MIVAKCLYSCMPEIRPDQFEDSIIRKLAQDIVEKMILDNIISFEQAQDFSGLMYRASVTCCVDDGLHDFSWAYKQMMDGKCVRRKDWAGYWYMQNGELYIQCANSILLNLRESDDMPFTLSNIAANDWVLVEEKDRVKHDAG